MDISIPPPLPPPPPLLTNSNVPKFDTSVPPPSVPTAADLYQNWALQWQYFQQAQAAAAYQTQFYQSFANQNKSTPTPVPPVNTHNNSSTNNSPSPVTTSKWQPTSNDE